jgi:hypothetical protein
MTRVSPVVGLLAGIVVACGCGYFPNGSDGSDPYLGYVDGLGLDLKFEPVPRGGTCPNGPCFPVQQGFAKGQSFSFYNLGAIASSTSALTDPNGNFIFPTSLVTTQVSDFSGSQCTPPTSPYTFNPQTEAFPSNQQYPIFNSLPLTTFVFGAVVVPIVQRFAATEPSSAPCQGLKMSSSVGSKFGSSAGSAADFRLWAVIDTVQTGTLSASGIASTTGVNGQSCPIAPGSGQPTQPCPVQELPASANSTNFVAQCATAFNTCSSGCQDTLCPVVCQQNYIACTSLQQHGWEAGLQLSFLNGGTVPLSPTNSSAFQVMDGAVILPHDPGSPPSTYCAANQVACPSPIYNPANIILPAVPGDPGWSPIVRLHEFHVAAGVDVDSFGNFYNTVYTAICTNPGSCQPNEVDLTQALLATNVMFVVANNP